jgi:hypothetical protein
MRNLEQHASRHSAQAGGQPCLLTVDLQLAIYRSLIEAVSLLLELEPGRSACAPEAAGRASVAASLPW